MTMKPFFLICLLAITSINFAQDKPFIAEEISISKWIDGTLLTPNTKDNKQHKLAIIIAGSGPTNRDGNQNFLKNDALKKLAEGLSNKGIATFRYDKRIVKQIRQNNVDPNIVFDDFVTDASAVLDYFKAKGNYSKIYIIGHSQGSLVGMLAAKDKADGFISLAGAGQNIGDVIIEQINKTAPGLAEQAKPTVEKLKAGQTTTDYPAALANLFGPSIQEFMINWMAYEPSKIINTLQIPILIINGTKDIQVSEAEAERLKEANTNAKLVIIENMNHVLFEIKGDDLENSKSYNEASRPIVAEVINAIVAFIK